MLGSLQHTIPIVDDTPENISVLMELLGGEYLISVATNGKLALPLTENASPPDFILLDIFTHAMNGYEVCAYSRKIPVPPQFRSSSLPDLRMNRMNRRALTSAQLIMQEFVDLAEIFRKTSIGGADEG
ncbi:MAG: hypothetical protein PHY09_03770 [Desulfuromonadaceae bacterium]|nr:hypothetical protein [Desulfuromonadaceae bacterium]MDD5104132.1 hypothetical protein [Desulfuromonadaceae bacterium]